MQKLAKRLSVLMAAIMTLSLMLNFVMAAPAKAAAPVYPQVQYAQEPQLEYTVGDRVQFNLFTPNYGGRVQYRVVLWQDETKSYKDLWTTTPDRYYDKWMPYGNNIFTLGWPISEPGHYRITIYAKRAGIANNDTYLKGFNCDSYMESDSFVVKAKEVVKEPDVPAEALTIEAKSVQQIVGQEYAVTANVKKAGVKVIFLIDAPADSLNKDLVGEAVSDSNGVATYNYTRTYADAEYVTAFSAAAPTVRDAQKVFWGVKPILTIAGVDEGDAASILNGGVKQYKVVLTNPLTGEPMKYKEIKVMLKENIDTQTADVKSTATVTNDFNGTRVTPYQRVNNIVPGGLNEVTLSLVTNDNGEATFTLTGYNTKATPVVFYDSYQFFNELQAVQLFQFEYINQLPAPITLPDTSQYAPTFAGDYDNRLDATELQAEAKTVSFDMTQYTFESSMDGTKYVAVDDSFKTGRTYTITVLKPDGKAFANGKVMVRLEELFDNNLNNDCDARIIKMVDKDNDDSNGNEKVDQYKALELSLDGSGKAKFKVASDELNDIATPRVWVDQDTKDRDHERDGIYSVSEPTKLLDTIYFVNEAIEKSSIAVEIDNGDLEVEEDADGNVVNLGGYTTNYKFTIKDQNGRAWVPDGSEVLLTYTLTNDGSEDITIFVPDLEDVKVGRRDMDDDYTLEPDETITITGIDDDEVSMLQAATDEGTSGRLSVKVHAVVTKSHDQEWIWSQPTNTVGALVSSGTAVSSWVEWETYEDYTKRDVPVRGKVVALDKAEKLFVINLDNDEGTWIMIPDYTEGAEEYLNSEYWLTYPADRDEKEESNFKEFDQMLTLGDSVYYIFDTDEYEVFYRLYNSDNSNDKEELDDYDFSIIDNPDWTVDGGDYVVFSYAGTFNAEYALLDQYGELIESDEDCTVVVEFNDFEEEFDLVEYETTAELYDLPIDELKEGINEIKAYLVDEDGDVVSGSSRYLDVLLVDEDYDGYYDVNGKLAGFDDVEGQIIIKSTKGHFHIISSAYSMDRLYIDGESYTPEDFIEELVEGDHLGKSAEFYSDGDTMRITIGKK